MIPKRPVLRLGVLQLLADGKELQPRHIMTSLADKFKLTDEDRARLIPSGFETVFNKSVGWAITDLKREGLIDAPKRATYVITDSGSHVLEHHPSILNGQDFGKGYINDDFRNLPEHVVNTPVYKRSINSKYTLGAFEQGRGTFSNIGEFASILKGRSIIEVNDLGEHNFQLGLSGDISLNIFARANSILKNIDTSQKGIEISTFTLDLGDMNRKVPIALMTYKLDALRTLYAIIFLLQNNRATELEYFLLTQPNGDIEQSLLQMEERLCVESISYGSFVAVMSSGVKAAYKALMLLGGLVFNRYREAFIKKAETEVKLNEALALKTSAETREIDTRVTNDTRKMDAEIRKLDAETNAIILSNCEKEFELKKNRYDYMFELVKQMESSEANEILKRRLIEETKKFLAGHNSDNEPIDNLGE